ASLQESLKAEILAEIFDAAPERSSAARAFWEKWSKALMCDLADSSLNAANRATSDDERANAVRFSLWALANSSCGSGSFVSERLPKFSPFARSLIEWRARVHALRSWLAAIAGVLAFWAVLVMALTLWTYHVLCRLSFYRP